MSLAEKILSLKLPHTLEMIDPKDRWRKGFEIAYFAALQDAARLVEADVELAELRKERDALRAEVSAWRTADRYCDMLGYLAGEYDKEVDGEGLGLREVIRLAKEESDAALPQAKGT